MQAMAIAAITITLLLVPLQHARGWIFKGRDADAITAAFKEYSAKQMSKTAEKPSLLSALRDLMEKVKNQVLDQTKHKDRGRDL